ncbi:glycosyltransferase [Phycicoccus sp. MAQZ13P-2]|uniref:glycosyltransferase n=1 Tax=Phycicoccus mangrovi TaxID=2840470 RepID=UPI001C0013CC|nr:glycosyltransferase [Phycicoccus mangrovi]MBT9257621.1 glycosyltransferase [Phycicoccus mangrovi]MBT9276060.1 glycosyltransferase [Phycicoccus mangrovi]
MTRVLFLGFALPEDEFAELVRTDAGMPTATQRFGWSVIESLMAAGLDVTALSAAPAADFPHNRRVVFRAGNFRTADGVRGRLLPFLNITGLKHVTRYAAALGALSRSLRTECHSAILVHGVHSPFIWAAVRAGRRAGVPVVVIMTDPPSLRTRFDRAAAMLMKRVDKRLIESGLQRVEGVVSLTEALARDFAPGRPLLLMEGIARPLQDRASEASPHRKSGTRAVVLYAGGLKREYGVEALLQAVALSDDSWQLHLYGGGPMEQECRVAADKNPRVVFHGVVDFDSLSRGYADATVLVNPRPLQTDFVQYSFPSKLLEYMTTGTPVVTTHLPTIPSSYDPFVVYTEDDAASMAATLDSTLALAPGELRQLGSTARSFVTEACSPPAQGVRISSFLRTLSKASERAG